MICLNLGNQFENDAVKLFEIIRKKMKEQLSGHILIDHHEVTYYMAYICVVLTFFYKNISLLF